MVWRGSVARLDRSLISVLALACISACASSNLSNNENDVLELRYDACPKALSNTHSDCAILAVPENWRTQNGREIPLKIIVINAATEQKTSTPVFFFAGGPGETATDLVDYLIERKTNAVNDVVVFNQRGAGDGHRLDCPPPWSDDDLGAYLRGPFVPAVAAACAELLSQSFDLSQYSTFSFVEDIEAVRKALRYDDINIVAGSFGTYAAQMYMRAYPDRVRAAFLNSPVLIENKVPLNLSADAQYALDSTFHRCAEEGWCSSAYPDLREKFYQLLDELAREPRTITIAHVDTGAPMKVRLTRDAFADAVRLFLYAEERAVRLPGLINSAEDGNFAPFAEAAIRSSRGIYTGVRMGLHFAVTCNEFVARIDAHEIEQATRGTFLGARRIRDQLASCAAWPATVFERSKLRPFSSDIPAVIVSGESDPATPSRWGEKLHAAMANSIHIIVPGAGHTPYNSCLGEIRTQLFLKGAVDEIDTSCIDAHQTMPFE